MPPLKGRVASGDPWAAHTLMRAASRSSRRESRGYATCGRPRRAEAETRGATLVGELRAVLPAVAEWLEATLPETLGFYVLPEVEARRRLRTTNTLEREHEEIRRRTRVIRIFPNETSYLRLATALAADRNDAWAKRRYVVPATPPARARPVKRPRRRAA